MSHKQSKFKPKKRGDVVIKQSENKYRLTWPLAIIEDVFPVEDGVVWAVRVKTTNGTVERAVQHLYPLELNLRC